MRTVGVIVTGAALLYAFTAASSGFDRIARDTPATERLVAAPFRSEADRAAALTALARERPAEALVHAKAAVARDPIDPDAAAVLGAAHFANGDTDAAAGAFRIAARFGWRNILTQSYWYEAALGAGDYPVAADRADAILRVHPRLAEDPDLLKPMETSAAGSRVLAERLALAPSWLEPYLMLADDAPAELVERRLGVVEQVDTRRHALGCAPVSRLVSALAAQGRRADAQAVWNGHCPENAVTGHLADPTFHGLITPSATRMPLSWQPVSSGDVSLTAVDEAGKSGLRAANSAPTARLVTHQATAFPPGTYRFRLLGPRGHGAGGEPLALSWACGAMPPYPAPGAGDLLGEGQVVVFAACPRQRLGLWIRGNVAGVEFSELTFERLR